MSTACRDQIADCVRTFVLVLILVMLSGLVARVHAQERWSGKVTEGSKTYTVDVTFGRNSAKVSYQQLSCGGDWTLISETDGKRIYRETITYGGRCVHGIVSIYDNGNGGLSYRWSDTPGSRVRATAELALATGRKSAPPPAPGIHVKATGTDFPAGTWKGTYVCQQGLTGVTLTFAHSGDPSGTARFTFYRTAGGPFVPDGTFIHRIEYDAPQRKLELKGMRWINQPETFKMIDITATVSADWQRMTGKIHHPPGP